jgi:sugar phosphate isomerase/epimerase
MTQVEASWKRAKIALHLPSSEMPMSNVPLLGIAARPPQPDLSDLPNRLDEIEELGVDLVELPAYALDLVINGLVLETRLSELEAACHDRPFGYTVHGPLAINFMGSQAHLPAYMAAARAFIEISARIRARHLVLHSGMLLAEEMGELDLRLARQRDALSSLGDHASAHGVRVCVENLFEYGPYRWTPSPGQLAAEIAAIGHAAVRATFDVSHALIHAAQAGFDFLDEAKALAPVAVHLHLHDSFGRPELPWAYAPAEEAACGAGDLHLPVGWGAVPWSALGAHCRFPEDMVAIHELNPRFWRDRREAMVAMRRVVGEFARGPARTDSDLAV